jgi:hypothetical protein
MEMKNNALDNRQVFTFGEKSKDAVEIQDGMILSPEYKGSLTEEPASMAHHAGRFGDSGRLKNLSSERFSIPVFDLVGAQTT